MFYIYVEEMSGLSGRAQAIIIFLRAGPRKIITPSQKHFKVPDLIKLSERESSELNIITTAGLLERL